MLGNRWRILGEAPSEGAVRRWRVVHTGTGEPAEALTLRASASVDDQRAFLRAHRALRNARDPALVATREILDDLPAVVRDPLEDPTAADLRAPLPPDVVAAIGARLIPAVLAAGPATAGALLPSDVGIDARGAPVLAPRGRPLSRIDQAVSRAVAPEVAAGAPPDGASGLYGLGALLYRLATGRDLPWAGRHPTAPPAPPSTLQRNVPLALDGPILRLLSRDPADRPSALADLQALAGTLPDLRLHLRTSATALPAVRPPTAPGPAPANGGCVVLPARQVQALDPDRRSAVAGWAGLPLSAVEALADEGLPIVLEDMDTRGMARVRAVELSRESGFELLAVPARSAGPLPVAAATAAGVGALVVAALGLLAVGAEALALLALLFAALSGLFGGVAGVRAARWGAVTRLARRSRRRAAQLLADAEAGGLLTASWARLATARRSLARAGLPHAAAADVRDLLREIEQRLHGIAEVARASDTALAGIDATRLRTRLAALERSARTPEEIAERDRTARTVADLDEVLARRDALAAEAHRIEGTLDGIAALVARAADDGQEAALAELARATAAARREAP